LAVYIMALKISWSTWHSSSSSSSS